MRKVQFTETVLRDANQSLIATRLPYSKFEPILETMDKAGFYSAEVWGGATFDVCLRYLREMCIRDRDIVHTHGALSGRIAARRCRSGPP